MKDIIIFVLIWAVTFPSCVLYCYMFVDDNLKPYLTIGKICTGFLISLLPFIGQCIGFVGIAIYLWHRFNKPIYIGK